VAVKSVGAPLKGTYSPNWSGVTMTAQITLPLERADVTVGPQSIDIADA
jgi:hypothetical protein